MFIFTCFTGSILLIAYRVSVSSEKKVESSKADCDETQENTCKIIRISYAVKNITFEMMNDPKHRNYIGHLLKIGKGGSEYNL